MGASGQVGTGHPVCRVRVQPGLVHPALHPALPAPALSPGKGLLALWGEAGPRSH